MKKKNFYRKMCLSILIGIGLGFQTHAQNASSFDNAIEDTTIQVTDRNPFKVINQNSADKTVWVFMRNGMTTDTIIGTEVTTGKFGLGWVYILQNGIWRYNTFYACGYTTPCYASDLLVVDGLTYSLSDKYLNDTAYWSVPYATVSNPSATSLVVHGMTVEKSYVYVLATNNGFSYEQQIDINGIVYDSSLIGILQSPIVPNANYSWYINGNFIPNVTGASYVPKQIGTYTVIITWTVDNTQSANQRAEDSGIGTASFTFNITKLATPTGIENQNIDADTKSIYPNPASEQVYINAKGAFDYKIETANTTDILSGNGYDQVQISLSGLKAGVYYVYIKSVDKQSIKRLIVK